MRAKCFSQRIWVYLDGYRRLGNVQSRGGTREAKMEGYGVEDIELVEVQLIDGITAEPLGRRACASIVIPSVLVPSVLVQ